MLLLSKSVGIGAADSIFFAGFNSFIRKFIYMQSKRRRLFVLGDGHIFFCRVVYFAAGGAGRLYIQEDSRG